MLPWIQTMCKAVKRIITFSPPLNYYSVHHTIEGWLFIFTLPFMPIDGCFHIFNHYVPNFIHKAKTWLIGVTYSKHLVDWLGGREYVLNLIPPYIIQQFSFTNLAFPTSSFFIRNPFLTYNHCLEAPCYKFKPFQHNNYIGKPCISNSNFKGTKWLMSLNDSWWSS